MQMSGAVQTSGIQDHLTLKRIFGSRLSFAMIKTLDKIVKYLKILIFIFNDEAFLYKQNVRNLKN